MTDQRRYDDWIRQHVAADPTGTCAEVTARMVEAFPELRRVRGHYCPFDGSRAYPHWWCETAAGAIIDPTAAQFAGVGPGHYEAHVGAEPVGKCINCGEYVYPDAPSSVACSSACVRALELEFNR